MRNRKTIIFMSILGASLFLLPFLPLYQKFEISDVEFNAINPSIDLPTATGDFVVADSKYRNIPFGTPTQILSGIVPTGFRILSDGGIVDIMGKVWKPTYTPPDYLGWLGEEVGQPRDLHITYKGFPLIEDGGFERDGIYDERYEVDNIWIPFNSTWQEYHSSGKDSGRWVNSTTIEAGITIPEGDQCIEMYSANSHHSGSSHLTMDGEYLSHGDSDFRYGVWQWAKGYQWNQMGWGARIWDAQNSDLEELPIDDQELMLDFKVYLNCSEDYRNFAPIVLFDNGYADKYWDNDTQDDYSIFSTKLYFLFMGDGTDTNMEYWNETSGGIRDSVCWSRKYLNLSVNNWHSITFDVKTEMLNHGWDAQNVSDFSPDFFGLTTRWDEGQSAGEKIYYDQFSLNLTGQVGYLAMERRLARMGYLKVNGAGLSTGYLTFFTNYTPDTSMEFPLTEVFIIGDTDTVTVENTWNSEYITNIGFSYQIFNSIETPIEFTWEESILKATMTAPDDEFQYWIADTPITVGAKPDYLLIEEDGVGHMVEEGHWIYDEATDSLIITKKAYLNSILSAGGSLISLDIGLMYGTGAVEVYVKDQDGDPISDANILFEHTATQYYTQDFTEIDGDASFAGLPSGEYVFTVSAFGIKNKSVIDLAPYSTISLSVTIDVSWGFLLEYAVKVFNMPAWALFTIVGIFTGGIFVSGILTQFARGKFGKETPFVKTKEIKVKKTKGKKTEKSKMEKTPKEVPEPKPKKKKIRYK